MGSSNSVMPEKLHPYCMGIMLTNDCNLACKYCFSEAGDKEAILLSKQKIDTIISEVVRNAQVHTALSKRGLSNAGTSIDVELTISGGGKPTFYWEQFKYTVESFKEKCAKNGLKSSILLVTNGIQQDEHARFIIENCERINVSFDGTPELQNSQRPMRNGRESFRFVDRFIRNCEKYGKRILVRSTIMADCMHKIGEIVDYVFGNYSNVSVVHIEPMMPFGRAERLDHIIGENISKEFVAEYIKQSDRVTCMYPGRELFCTLFDYELKDYFCSAAVGAHPWVHPNGLLYPCKDELDAKHCIGVVENNIRFNSSFEPLSTNLDKCRKCFAFYHCAGGCPRNIPKDVYGNCATEEAKFNCSAVQWYWKHILSDASKGIAHGRFVVEEIGDFPMRNLFRCVRIIENT